MRKLRLTALAALLLLGGLAIWHREHSLYHFAEVDPGILCRDGFKDLHQFDNACMEGRIRTIVSLIDEQELAEHPFDGEAAFCRERNIQLVRIPIPVGGEPTSEQVDDFLNLVANGTNGPILVHCAQGVKRTAMMVAAYQMSVMGFDKQTAKKAVLPFGRSPDRLNDIRKFIDAYNPQTRQISAHVSVPADRG